MTEDVPLLRSTSAFYKGRHRYSFRGGERSEIIGVRMVDTKFGKKPCFMLLYSDGFVDYAPLEDIHSYEIGE